MRTEITQVFGRHGVKEFLVWEEKCDQTGMPVVRLETPEEMTGQFKKDFERAVERAHTFMGYRRPAKFIYEVKARAVL